MYVRPGASLPTCCAIPCPIRSISFTAKSCFPNQVSPNPHWSSSMKPKHDTGAPVLSHGGYMQEATRMAARDGCYLLNLIWLYVIAISSPIVHLLVSCFRSSSPAGFTKTNVCHVWATFCQWGLWSILFVSVLLLERLKEAVMGEGCCTGGDGWTRQPLRECDRMDACVSLTCCVSVVYCSLYTIDLIPALGF